MKRTIGRAVAGLVVAAVLAACGCGGNQPPDTISQVALRGREVILVANQALGAVDTLLTANLIPREDGLVAIKVIKGVGEAGEELAGYLDLANRAKEPAALRDALVKAGETIQRIQRLLASGLVPIGSQAARKQIGDILGTISQAVTQVALLMPAPA